MTLACLQYVGPVPGVIAAQCKFNRVSYKTWCRPKGHVLKYKRWPFRRWNVAFHALKGGLLCQAVLT